MEKSNPMLLSICILQGQINACSQSEFKSYLVEQPFLRFETHDPDKFCSRQMDYTGTISIVESFLFESLSNVSKVVDVRDPRSGSSSVELLKDDVGKGSKV